VTAPGGSAQDYTSDAFGNLIGAPGGITYGYDALGRLVTRGTSAGTASLSYLGTGSSVASDGSDDYSYDPSGSLVAAGAAGGTGYSTLSDLHGDVTAAFSPSASASALAGSAAYGPYGAVIASSGTMPGLGYQGAYTDPSTGLVDMGARWYDPATGSFTADDAVAGSPLSSTVDGNSYAYGSGDPLTETDPTGHLLAPPATAELSGLTDLADVAGLYGELFALSFDAGYEGASMLDSGGYAMPGDSFGPLMSAVGGWASENDYALDSGEIVSGPTLASVPAGSDAATGPASPPVTYPVPVPPPPPPPPQDCYAGPAPTCVPPVPPASLTHQELITRVPHDSTSVSALFKAHKGITEHTPARQGPVKGTSATGVSSDPSNDETGDDISRVTAPLNGIGVPATPQAPGPASGGNVQNASVRELGTSQSSTAAGAGSGGRAGGNTPAGVPQDCGLGDWGEGQVRYGSNAASRMIQDERLLTGDKGGTYAVGCLDDGSVLWGRYNSQTDVHAEESLYQQANLRSFTQIYSERDPCEESCAPLMQDSLFGEGPSSSWSFEWNGAARAAGIMAFKAAMDGLFG